ncbi:hypothetical protein DS745_19155 [Anaerobacillus alkaliphilus]|uniref:Uncharacterized protein n=1 Tax=Anaerobacillus alkaliphilus TaxID=1548597 RepID=A0A4Q0VR29_9BACI|nr:hypothetical protein DS745_19155 [Anaerobacillus alkaliphilus]
MVEEVVEKMRNMQMKSFGMTTGKFHGQWFRYFYGFTTFLVFAVIRSVITVKKDKGSVIFRKINRTLVLEKQKTTFFYRITESLSSNLA